MFLEKEPGRKGVCSSAYLYQVLEPVIFPFFEQGNNKEDYWFMEDGSGIHKGYARLPRMNTGIKGFNWPPSSPDLNPIEKAWRWMKYELDRLPYVIKNLEELKREIQALWDRMDPVDFRRYSERLTCKLEDVIEVKGIVTIH